jgi:hypothetical protein
MDLKDLKCKSCGAPLKPMGGVQVITCDYCGSTVALSGAGWKMVQTHSMLVPQVIDQNQAMAVIQRWMDQGLLHRHDFENATLAEAKCSVVPYWIIPASAVTHYTYEDVAVQAAQVGGTVAASALLGAALSGGGRRGGFAVIPVMGVGGGGGAKRAGELAGQFQFPVIAVKGLQVYQPRDYQFDIAARLPFDKRKLPPGLQVLNGDVGEDDAKFVAKNMVEQLQAVRARQQHRMVESLKTEVNCGDGELLHAPVWYMNFQLKHGKTEMVVVDAHRVAVMNAQKPA